jgi:hypothetical protein
MTTQPEVLNRAIKLALRLECAGQNEAAAELRRLHKSNQELLKLLKESRKIIRASSSRNLVKDWDVRTTAAINRAEGEAK